MLALFNIDNILKNGGLALLALIVFAESGMLVGFFLPGDSLIFIAGFLASDAGGRVLPNIVWVILTIVAAAIVGDQVGYGIGKYLGPKIFNRQDSKLLNPANVDKTRVFFEHHGPKSIVLARFVPVVRALVAVVAGAGKMNYRKFVTYNVAGGVLWGAGVTLLGFWLGKNHWVKSNIEIVLIAVVVVSLLPVAWEFRQHRRGNR